MVDQLNSWQWYLIGQSVVGPTHARKGLHTQDAFATFPLSKISGSVILALSDGHGGRIHFRSDIGADLAVKVAQEVMQAFLQESLPTFSKQSDIKSIVEDRIPETIVRKWQTSVKDYNDHHPFDSSDLIDLDDMDKQIVENNPLIAYGATLLVVLVTEKFIVYLRLGDGEIITVSENGDVDLVKFLRDNEQVVSTEVVSLCLRKAWRYFHTNFQALSHKWPVLILLSTDGYRDAFDGMSAFLKVGSDILEIIREHGLAYVEDNLKAWLTEAVEFTGDDATVGILCRTDILNEISSPNGDGEHVDGENSIFDTSEVLDASQSQETEPSSVLTDEKSHNEETATSHTDEPNSPQSVSDSNKTRSARHVLDFINIQQLFTYILSKIHNKRSGECDSKYQ